MFDCLKLFSKIEDMRGVFIQQKGLQIGTSTSKLSPDSLGDACFVVAAKRSSKGTVAAYDLQIMLSRSDLFLMI